MKIVFNHLCVILEGKADQSISNAWFNPLLQRIFLLTIVVVVVFSATGCWCITNLK